MTETSGPDYQRIADDIRGRIRSGEYPLGAAIPSTPKLEKQYGVSKTPVRQAVDQLQREGILAGLSGKGVYVRAVPGEAAGAQDLQTLSKQVAGLIEAQGRLEGNLVELYDKTGHDYPYEDLPPGAEEEGDRREQHA